MIALQIMNLNCQSAAGYNKQKTHSRRQSLATPEWRRVKTPSASLSITQMVSLLNKSILTTEHAKAIEWSIAIADKLKKQGVITQSNAQQNNVWQTKWLGISDTSIDYHAYHILAATLYYLAGRTGTALDALADIRANLLDLDADSDNNKSAFQQQQWQYLASLRMAQMLITRKPTRAQKIAEDISYIAQERAWLRLEYLATTLDGWANYALKKYYKALVCFTKARNMLPPKIRATDSLTLTQRLGKLATRLELKKIPAKKRRRDYLAYQTLAKKLEKELHSKSLDTPVAFLVHWLPLPRQFFVKNILGYQKNQRKLVNVAAMLQYYNTINDSLQASFP